MPTQYRPFEWKRFDKDLAKLMDNAARQGAMKEATRQAQAIESGKAADGSRQKSNETETTRKKGGRGVLIDTGVLADAGSYRVVRNSTKAAQAWSLLPAATRVSVLGYLADLGYAVWRVPSTVVQDDSEFIRRGIKNLKRSYQGRPKT